VFDLVPATLRAELRALVHRCRRDRDHLEGSTTRLNDAQEADLYIRPVLHRIEVSSRKLVAICFERSTLPVGLPPVPAEADDYQSRIIAELGRELGTTREHLQTVVEELETSNEELQSLNEELQSSNEELQSTNEELQTSNEELQSTNEELLTVNDELRLKSSELEQINNDLLNIKDSLSYPLLVVDGHNHYPFQYGRRTYSGSAGAGGCRETHRVRYQMEQPLSDHRPAHTCSGSQ
jgi:two-component system CheB/CheR fusion protein